MRASALDSTCSPLLRARCPACTRKIRSFSLILWYSECEINFWVLSSRPAFSLCYSPCSFALLLALLSLLDLLSSSLALLSRPFRQPDNLNSRTICCNICAGVGEGDWSLQINFAFDSCQCQEHPGWAHADNKVSWALHLLLRSTKWFLYHPRRAKISLFLTSLTSCMINSKYPRSAPSKERRGAGVPLDQHCMAPQVALLQWGYIFFNTHDYVPLHISPCLLLQ